MSAALSGETFAGLQGFSAHTALTALSARSFARDLDSLEAVLGHIESSGFQGLEANTHMRVHLDGLARKKDDKAKDTPFITERITSALARFIAPPLEQSRNLGKTTLLNLDCWSPRHEVLFNRTIEAIKTQGNRAMLGDFAFDVVSMVPRRDCMEKLIAAGAKPGETGQTACDDNSHEHRSLVHEAFLWGNLPAAAVLVSALPAEKFPALAKLLLDDQGMRHAALGTDHIKFKEVSAIHMAMTESEAMHPHIDALLCVLEEKDKLLGLQIRNAVLQNHFDRAVATKRDWTWTEKGVALLLGAEAGQDLSTTPLAQLAKSLDPAKRSLDTDEVTVRYQITRSVGNAIAAHCASYIKAFPELVLQSESSENFFATMSRAVSTESMKLAINGAVRPGKTERFKETITALMEIGVPLVRGPEYRKESILHYVAYNTNEDDRSHKLPILLSMGADPEAKNKNGNKPRMVLKKADERPQWDHIVQTHQARAAAYSAMAEMDPAPTPPAARP